MVYDGMRCDVMGSDKTGRDGMSWNERIGERNQKRGKSNLKSHRNIVNQTSK